MPVCPQCASENLAPARFCGQCGASFPDPERLFETDAWLGRVVDGRYRVLSRVGSGGMGMVYRVEHIQLGKVAAMKVLHADTARDSEAVRRFRTEAQAVSRLNHPNIVQTFDFGQSEGALYLVMEYVKGDDLATMVKRDGPLSFDRAAPLFVQICSALTDAHDAGVIHRDLKPENIVVFNRRDGSAHAKVLDFGLAKLHERTDGAEITSGGQVIGTPYYMSPEQVRSEPLDVRTDIYSLGATLYRVLTGTPPFQATTPVGVLTKHITDPLEPPRTRAPELNLPVEADAIVTRAMAKSREDRYATAAAVQRDLEAAIVRTGGTGRSPDAAEGRAAEAGRQARRNRPTANAPTIPVGNALAEVASRERPTIAHSAETVASGEERFGSERLRRSDFDAFEHSLRRRKTLLSVVLPASMLILVGIIAGVWALGRGREKGSAVEREPNDTPGQANLLPLDTPVQGTIGKRLGAGQPDMDYFRVPPAKVTRLVSARLAGIPDVDFVLELFDAQGALRGKIDAQGLGGGEWLQPVSIGPGEAYLLVRQVWIQGVAPVENVADPYRLAVHWSAPSPGWEIEPNDEPGQATPLEPGRSIQGYLAGADDSDWFFLVPTGPGRLVGRIKPPQGVEVVIVVQAAKATPEARPVSKTGDIDLLVVPGQRIALGFARKPAGGSNVKSRPAPDPQSDSKAEGLLGLDDPYELKLDLRSP